MPHRNDPTTTVPLVLHKNSLHIRPRPLAHHVRLVAAEDIPVRLSTRSPTDLLDHGLDELAVPNHGTKLNKRTLVEQRENELLRVREAQAAHGAVRMVGPDGRRMELTIPLTEPREPSKTEPKVHELPHLRCNGAIVASRDEELKILTNG